MVSELVGRLREVHRFLTLDWQTGIAREMGKTANEAADRIEALESDCRMKDELLTAAVDDFNRAKAKLKSAENSFRAIKTQVDDGSRDDETLREEISDALDVLLSEMFGPKP